MTRLRRFLCRVFCQQNFSASSILRSTWEVVTSECPSVRNLMKPQGGSWEDPRGSLEGFSPASSGGSWGADSGGDFTSACCCVVLFSPRSKPYLNGVPLLQNIGVFACLPACFPALRGRIDRSGFGPAADHPTFRFIPAVFCKAERFSHQHARRRSEVKTLPLRPPL